MTITDPHVKVPVILDMIFPETWLAEQAMGDAEGRTNREVQTDVRSPYHSYPFYSHLLTLD